MIEQIIPREMLYIAEELFFSGTAAEITPIRSVDKITVGNGARRADHQDGAQGVLWHRQRYRAGSLRLADAGSGEADGETARHGIRRVASDRNVDCNAEGRIVWVRSLLLRRASSRKTVSPQRHREFCSLVCVRARLQSPLKISALERFVSGHDFSLADKALFSMPSRLQPATLRRTQLHSRVHRRAQEQKSSVSLCLCGESPFYRC